MDMKPSPERLAELHRRLIAGDAAAPAEFIELLLPWLVEEMGRARGRLRDEQIAFDAATDALVHFVKAPGRYDNAQASITSYLNMAARRNLSNALLKERRHKARIFRLEPVAQAEAARNETSEGLLADLGDRDVARKRLEELTGGQMGALSTEDHAVLRLLSDGERSTERFAFVMGIAGKSDQEKKLLVKQAKDRLLRRLRRSSSETDHD